MIQLSMHIPPRYCSNKHCRLLIVGEYKMLQLGTTGHIFKVCGDCFNKMEGDLSKYLEPKNLAKPITNAAARQTLRRMIRGQ